MPEGSVCHVEKENKKTYRVIWSSMAGTYRFTIPKSIATTGKTDLEKIIDFIKTNGL